MGGRGSWSGGRYVGGGVAAGNIANVETFRRGSFGNTKLEEAVESSEAHLLSQYSAFADAGSVQVFDSDSPSLANTYGFVYVGGKQVFLNKRYFDNESGVESQYASDVKSGFHVKGTTASSVVVHEYGHVGHNLIMQKYPVGSTFMGQTVRNSNDVVNIMTEYAKMEANKSTGKKWGINDWAKSISRYANENAHELVAEAFTDYFTHGNRANAFSREIGKIFRKELN